MPVHFNSFVSKNQDETELLMSFAPTCMERAIDVCGSKDKQAFHLTDYIVDKVTKDRIGKVVITVIAREDTNEVVDFDITLLSEKAVELNFLKRLSKSTEATEYYEVSTIDDERHFQIETVNFYALDMANLENTKQKVYLSLFPFQLDVFCNIEELNKTYGFSKPIKVGETDMKVNGFAEDTVAVGGMFIDSNEPSSFIISKVKDFYDVTAIIGETPITFTIINVDTAMGIIPVAASREQFDLSNLSIGKIICMLADVKADFQK